MTVCSHDLKKFVSIVIVVMACIGLASYGGDEMIINPPPQGQPDLVVGTPSVRRQQSGDGRVPHPVGGGAEFGGCCCTGHDAALLPLDGCNDYDVRHVGGDGCGGEACGFGECQRVDRRHGAGHSRHLLLRRLCGCGGR